MAGTAPTVQPAVEAYGTARILSVPRVLAQDMISLDLPERVSDLLQFPQGSAASSLLSSPVETHAARESPVVSADAPRADVLFRPPAVLVDASRRSSPETREDPPLPSRGMIAVPERGETEALMRIEIARRVRGRFDMERFKSSDAAGQRALLGAIWGEWERAGLAPVPVSRLGFPSRWDGAPNGAEPADRGEARHGLVREYRIGGNNKRIVSAILEDLERRYGVMVEEAYGRRTEVRDDKLYLSEDEIDRYMGIIQRTQEFMARYHRLEYDPARDLFPHWESMLRFILAHEYFHLALMHLAVIDGRPVEGFSTRVHGSEFKRLAELQANYLAADYIEELGLSTKYPAIFLHSAGFDLEKGEEIEHSDYPPGWAQREVIEMLKTRIHWGLFRNEQLDAVGRVQQLEIADGEGRVYSRILNLLHRSLERLRNRKLEGK